MLQLEVLLSSWVHCRVSFSGKLFLGEGKSDISNY